MTKVRLTNIGYRKTNNNQCRVTNTVVGEHIYVSTTGLETNDGSKDNPVLSITKAIELAELKSGNIVTIILFSGIYRISNTIIINSDKDLRFFGIGNVEIKGSSILSCSITDNNRIIKSYVGSNRFYQIFINNGKRFASSTERPDLLKSYSGCSIPSSLVTYNDSGITKQKFTMNPYDIQNLALNDNYLNGWITIFHQWASCKAKILSVDTVNNTISFRTAQNPSGQGNLYASYGDWIIFENFNIPLVINSSINPFLPGTYYLNSDGYVYYYMKEYEDINNIELSIPVCDVLFDLRTKVSFDNIKFSESNYEFFDLIYACSDTQSAYAIDSAIKVYSSNVRFTRCEFVNISQNCIGFMNGSSASRVDNCYFHNIGCSSIRIGEIDQSAVNVPTWVIINNCVIEYVGELLQQSAGIIIGFAESCYITHCDISKTFYTGITSGHIWGSSNITTGFKNCYIGYNHVHHISCKKMNDLGGIYNLGDSQGLIIENNIIHDVKSKSSSYNIYLDEASRNVVVRNNISYNGDSGIMFHICNNNTSYNNIFAFMNSMYLFSGDSYDKIYKSIFYGNNIFYRNNAGLPLTIDIHDNMYWKIDGSLSYVSNDSNPVIANPNFNNPSNFDFSFYDMTNANLIGFTPIKTDKVGVIGNRMKSILTLNENFYDKYKAIY